MGAPVGGQVLSEVLPYLELKKDNVAQEDIKKEVEVPQIEGLSLKEAGKMLKDVGLELKVNSEEENLDKEKTIVKTQIPKRGIKVYEGTNVIVEIK